MPTFSAIALDRLLEPGASKSVDKSAHPPKPIPNRNLERRNSSSTTERKVHRPQITPALYATPEVAPLPDSPSSFPPSPYIINHKRRGPRLLKSSSEANVSSNKKALDDEKVTGKEKNFDIADVNSTGEASVTFTISQPAEEKQVNGVHDCELSSSNADLGFGSESMGRGSITNGLTRENNSPQVVELDLEREGENEDFLDPQDSMSITSSIDAEDNMWTARSMALTTSGGEFFDACEELSSEGGSQTSIYDVEAELREIRLGLLMEVEKRKQAEEALNKMSSQWERIRQRLSHVGLTFPADPTTAVESIQLNSDPVEDLCEQVNVARFVTDIIGRGTARAEVEMEMEAQIESKNFEIARLLDRLHFYETVNQEMSQRNQEAVEMARRERQRRRRRQRWIWGSMATAIALGTAAIAWSYVPAGRGTSSADHSEAPEHDNSA
ncbi:Netrin receptor DCC [Quillaja saponaria]|uniref:Netrin receptor DCC n=1 Tax=Quillaja saponaria TaxID=32244 RepID=A0AAD7L892_QUISA|nr:Netrin receptor DCC [Quillaja saponaria]